MPQVKQSATNLKKKQTWSTKKKIIIIAAIIFASSLIVFASVFAYQIYLENIQTNQSDGCLNSAQCQDRHFEIDKPVIYLYPTKTEDVNVKLEYAGKLVSTYPNYDKTINGWQVTANPDGTLKNKADGKEYSYLFWEGVGNTDYSKFENGFVIKGSDTKDFLQSTLGKLGLTPREYNEMIVYWLPKMENNKYNLIYFAGKEYTDSAKLTITPTPDSILRVFMVFKPLEKYYQIPQQQITTFNRKGFAVVEWGGTEIK
jgi:archaellum component FlaF (FlaF/FlaG flagellin family)/uncharacterized protein YdhG (YjbR/CyaY superfamily)